VSAFAWTIKRWIEILASVLAASEPDAVALSQIRDRFRQEQFGANIGRVFQGQPDLFKK
jgi:hypothetical protein